MKSRIEIQAMLTTKEMLHKQNLENNEVSDVLVIQIDTLRWVLKDEPLPYKGGTKR